MKKIAFLILVTLIANSQELKVCQTEQDRQSGCIEKKYYENGKLKSEVPFKNGKAEGIAKSYYENGNLEIEASFKNGKAEGIAKGYHANGKLSYEIPYKNGKLEGMTKVYDKKGIMQAEILYHNDKPVSGKCKNGKNLTNAHLHNLKIEPSIELILQFCQ